MLLGVNSTAHWFWGGQDTTNNYVVQGVNGGLLTLVLFLNLLAVAFGGIGRAWRCVESESSSLALAWGLGVSLLVHCFNFFGVAYFGTIWGPWYLTLGIIGSLSPAKSAGTRSNSAQAPSHAYGSVQQPST